jgi:integrase
MLLIDVARRYIRSPGFQSLAHRTKINYSNGITSLEPLMNFHVKAIKRPDVIAFRDSLWQKPGKCQIAIKTLNNLMRFAIDNGELESNPVYRVTIPKERHIDRWEKKQIEKFISNTPEHLSFAMLMAYYTGQRVSDLVRMAWQDYDGDTIKVSQRKTGKELLIPVHPRLKAALDARRIVAENCGTYRHYILWNHEGNPYSTGALSIAFSRHARNLGIKRAFHGIRKSTASMLAESGCSAKEIMSLTGHSSLREVEKYIEQADQVRMARGAVSKWEHTSP